MPSSGQNVEFASRMEIRARLPDRMRLDVTSDRNQRQFFYDGQRVVIYAPAVGAYAAFDGGATIAAALETAAADYALELPLADLFTWGSKDDDSDLLTDAFSVGVTRMGGEDCEHYVFLPGGHRLAAVGAHRRGAAALPAGDHHHRRAKPAALCRDPDVGPRRRVHRGHLHLHADRRQLRDPDSEHRRGGGPVMTHRSARRRGAIAALGLATVLALVTASVVEARQVHRGAHVNVNRHVNVKTTKKNVNVNVKNNVKVNRDIHADWDRHHYHPVATGVAVGAAAAITAAAIGSVVYSLPAGCGYRTINGVRYYECGGVWYEQRYSGSQLTYVVVPAR
jgi:hypothetical protein